MSDTEQIEQHEIPAGVSSSYEKPRLIRVELAIDETLSSGCKLGSDSGCVGPPLQAFEGGS